MKTKGIFKIGQRKSKQMLCLISLYTILGPFSFFDHSLLAQVNSTPLVFVNSTLISGSNGAVNAVYKFPTVTDGVDAQVTLSAISNGASLSDVDIPASNTGYDPAFQPYVTLASGTSGSPKTCYIEWKIRFKKEGTNTDTTLSAISATAIDVDGTTNLQEKVQAYTPSSYSVNSPNGMTVTTDGVSVTSIGPTTNYNGIDSAVKSVMFQMNFENVNLITYRTGGINKSSSSARQFSIYFKAFFEEVTPLPVELLYFNAEAIDKKAVDLNWATGSETNNAYFILERGIDGINFEEMTALQGAGTTSKTSYYHYRDNSPEEGINYYRLIQTDHDGYQRIYEPIVVNLKDNIKELSIDNVFPNPFKAQTMITLSAPKEAVVQLSLLNSQGVAERSLVTEAIKGSMTWNVSGLQDLESGVYFLQAEQNGVISKTIRILKN